jgi:hypothetical protein
VFRLVSNSTYFQHTINIWHSTHLQHKINTHATLIFFSEMRNSERHMLSLRKQKESETVGDFVSELRRMAATCSFTTRESLEEILLQTVVNNLRDVRIREKLLSQGEITLAQALQQAQSYEAFFLQLDEARAAAGTSRSLSCSDTTEVAVVSRSTGKNVRPGEPWTLCWRCGRNHNAATCPVSTWSCLACNRIGHVARMCQTSRQRGYHRGHQSRGTSYNSPHHWRDGRGGSSPQQQQRGGSRPQRYHCQ